jgi:hypothetical protein
MSLVAFLLKKAVEPHTRAYRDPEVWDAFATSGFKSAATHEQFVLPMAAHRVSGRFGLLRCR